MPDPTGIVYYGLPLRKEDFREYSEETDGLEVAWYDPESEDWVDDMLSCYLERVGVRGPHDVTWDFGKYQENHECPLERDFAGSLYTGDSESFLCAWKTTSEWGMMVDLDGMSSFDTGRADRRFEEFFGMVGLTPKRSPRWILTSLEG